MLISPFREALQWGQSSSGFFRVPCTIPLMGSFFFIQRSFCLGDSQNQAFSTAVVEATSGCGCRDAG